MSINFFNRLPIEKGKILFFSGLFALLVFNFSIPVFAAGNSPTPSMPAMSDVRTWTPTPNMNPLVRFIEVDNDPLFTTMDVSLDVLGVVILLVALFVISKSIREYGSSTIGVAILYFFNATIVLGAIRFIFILDDDRISAYATVKDVTEMTAWHTLFYYAIILFYLAGRTLTRLVSSDKGKSSYSRALSLFIFSVILSITLIASMPMPQIQNFLATYLQNTWFETFGWFHIIALLLAGGIAIYLYGVKNKFKGYTGVIGDIYISLALLASIHLWELLNETWRIIVVSDDFGEFAERILWIPVFVFILTSFIKLRKMSAESPVLPESQKPTSSSLPSNSPTPSPLLQQPTSQQTPPPSVIQTQQTAVQTSSEISASPTSISPADNDGQTKN